MDAAAFDVSAVVCAVMSALLAVAIPVIVLRRATRARELRDRFLYARPGSQSSTSRPTAGTPRRPISDDGTARLYAFMIG